MADTKLSDLAELTAPAIDDELVAVDKSDTAMAASGTDKRIKVQTLQLLMAQAGKVPPTGITLANMDRVAASQTNATALVSGTMRMCAIWLPAGFTVTSISFVSGATALTTSGSGPHFWFALYDSARALLRQSNDDTAATWAANSLKTVNLSSTFVTTYTGTHYLALNVVCGSTGTMPTPTVMNYATATLSALAPIVHGVSSTGQGATAPNPAAAITASASTPYCGVA